MATNPIDEALGQRPASTPTQPKAPTPAASANPIDAALGGASPSFSGAPEFKAAPASSNPIDAAFGLQQLPDTRQPVKEPDANQSFLGKAWDWANTPLVDSESAQKWLGIDKGQGLEYSLARGVTDVATGLTSPLSILLTIGTLGEGGLVESGGRALLRKAGMSLAEISDVTRGAEAIAKATKNGTDALEALRGAGVDLKTVQKGLAALKDGGMTTTDLLSKSLVKNTASAALRGLGKEAPAAEKLATWIQGGVDAGFSVQNLYGAAMASPRVLDAIKEGDYDTATRLAVNVAGGAGFGLLGAHAAIHDAGGLMDDLGARMGLKVKPSDENLKLRNAFDRYAADVVEAGRAEELWADEIRKKYPEFRDADLHRIMKLVQAHEDYGRMAERYNALAEAAGREERLPNPEDTGPGTPSPISPLTPQGNPGVVAGGADYVRSARLAPVERREVATDPRATAIADAYEAMKHDPNDPAVKRAYDALKRDIKAQWNFATDRLGYDFEGTTADPYANSKEMMADVRDNKHLKFFKGGTLPADHPLAEVDPESGLTYNEMFRAVHDLFGHAAEGFEFGPKGEENAWNAHRQMFSPEAIPALTTETKGQNSWVNAGAHVRNEKGEVIKKGEKGYIRPQDRPFAEQKAGLLPREFWSRADDAPMTPDQILQQVRYGRRFAVLQAENPGNQRLAPEANAQRTAALLADLKAAGYQAIPVEGHTKDVAGNKENAFFVPNISNDVAIELGRKYGQAGIFTNDGLHWMSPEGDYVNPAEFNKVIIGDSARNSDYYTTLKTADGKEIPFSVPINDKVKMPPGVNSMTPELLKQKFGVTSKLQDAGYIVPDGSMIPLAASTHDKMLGAKPTDNAREDFINRTGTVRTRYRMTRQGEEVVFSIPRGGVTEEQARKIRNAATSLRGANVVMEQAWEGGKHEVLENPGVNDINAALDKMGGVKLGELSLSHLFSQLEQAFPNTTPAERAATVAVMQMRAKVLGMDFPEYVAQYHAAYELGSPEEAEKALAAGGLAQASTPRGIPRGSTVRLLDKPDYVVGEPTVENVGRALQNFTVGRSKLNALDLSSVEPDQMVDRAVKLGTSEIQRQLAEENSGRDWYGRDIKLMLDSFAQLHPELKEDPKLRGFFTAFVAGASLGNDSPSTMKAADIVYNEYKKTGKVPDTMRGMTRDLFGNEKPDYMIGAAYPSSNRAVLLNLQKVVDHVGGDPRAAYDWLMSKHPVSELREVKGGPVAGKATDERYGAYALAPKAGAFFLNMNGIEDQLTMDKWATRTWNRWMGTLIAPDGSVNERPRSQGEREVATKAFDEMRQQFGLSVREAQAVMWFYEQSLWKAHGLDIENGVNYGTAAQDYVRGKVRPEAPAEGGRPLAARGAAAAAGGVPSGGGVGAPEVPRGDLEGPETGDTSFDVNRLAQLGGVKPGPVWTYRSEQVVGDPKMPNRAPGDQWKQILEKNHVKPDEMKWMGLDDFLRGKDRVTRQELLDFINENKVEIKETELGRKFKSSAISKEMIEREDLAATRFKRLFLNSLVEVGVDRAQAEEAIDHGLGRVRSGQEGAGNMVARVSNLAGGFHRFEIPTFERILQRGVEFEKLANEIGDIAVRETGEYGKTEPKYKDASLRLPGENTNYREVLLTLPEATRDSEVSRGEALKQLAAGKDILAVGPDGDSFRPNRAELEDLNKDYRIFVSDVQAGFRGGHYANVSPNVLAHARLTDRIDADGKRVLMVEEVQSDWHQKGKKEGYQDKKTAAEIAPVIKNYFDTHGRDITDQRAKEIAEFASKRQFSTVIDMLWGEGIDSSLARELAGKLQGGVPDAPFKSDWHELVMKRMLRYAAENGYDRIAWVTGEQTADRYNLAKVVRKLSWNGDRVNLFPHEGEMLSFDVKDGKVFNPNGAATSLGLGGKPLEEVVGKDKADRILRTTNGEMSGEGLKFGGKWAENLYDRAIPNFLNKYVKKWGGKVGETKLVTNDYVGSRGASFKGDISKYQSSVHSLDITPEMKQSVMSGQHLFQREGKQLRGLTEFLTDGRAIIKGFESGALDTLIHETFHVFRRNLMAEERSIAEKLYGVKDGKWSRAQEEEFARDGEKFMQSGEAKNPQIRSVFTKLKGWLTDIFSKLVDSPVKNVLSDEKKQFFGRLLGVDAEAGRPGEMSPERIRELINEQHVAKKYSPKEIDKLLDSYDYRKISDQHKAAAKDVREHLSKNFENAQANGALEHGLEDYIPQMWAKDDADNAAANRTLADTRAGHFSINTSMAMHRVLNSAFEGELLGKKLAHTDVVALAAHNGNAFGRVIAARKALAELQDKGFRASDGRPMVALSGTGNVVEGPNGENPAVLVNPKAVRSIRIADKVVKGLEQSGELDKLVKDGRIIKYSETKDGNPHYAWATDDYRQIPHKAFQGWNFATQDTGGYPVLVKGDLRVHPEAHDYIQKLLGIEPSPLSQSGLGKAALGAGAEAKGILLFGSPFHVVQEGLRALMSGVSPFGIEKWDLRTDPALRRGVESGLTLKDYQGISSYQEGLAGHSKVLSKVPGLAQTQRWLENFLFEKYIPGLKARAYKSLFESYKKAYPEWSESKVAETAAADTNERFGGINYKRLGRSAATQDLFRLVTLAPDWLESEMRFMARSFGEEGKVARRDIARMAVGLWAAARVLNYLNTGNFHNEAPFAIATKDETGKEKLYSVRTLPTDMLHAISDPGGFLKGRAAPLVRAGYEAYSGRDDAGRKLPTHSIVFDIARNVLPIPVQSAVKAASGEMSPDLSNKDQLVKAAGGTVSVYRTEAQKLAAQLASNHAESGPVDQSMLRRHQATLEFEDRLRAGSMPASDLYEMVDRGQIPVKDAKTIMKNVQETHGMPSDIARLYARASRLPAPEFKQVWEQATSTEKAALSKLLIKKRVQYFKKMATEATPQERMADPTYRWFRNIFPNDAPW